MLKDEIKNLFLKKIITIKEITIRRNLIGKNRG